MPSGYGLPQHVAAIDLGVDIAPDVAYASYQIVASVSLRAILLKISSKLVRSRVTVGTSNLASSTLVLRLANGPAHPRRQAARERRAASGAAGCYAAPRLGSVCKA